jgi:peptidoglycan/LPS O-acetylase OafA/YrhL
MRLPVVYLPEFLLGMTVALAVKRGWRLPLRPAVPVLLLGAYVVFYYQGRARFGAGAVQQLDYVVRPVIALLSVLIILAFVQREVRGRRGVLNTRPLVLLGAWSYCFYLIHHSVSRIATYTWGRRPDNNWVIFTLLAMAVVLNLMAWLLFRFVEEPAEKWWRARTPQRWLRRTPPGDSPQPLPVPAPRAETAAAPTTEATTKPAPEPRTDSEPVRR